MRQHARILTVANHPNDFLSLQALEERLLGFQQHYATIAKPFKWKFTRHDLNKLMNKLKAAA